jgi:DNA-binding NtrC family response regulator
MTTAQTKIVIIDDEEDLCFLLGNMLIAQGFEVSSFYTLKSGLEAIERIRPQWVIIDNDLPDGRGWDKTSQILRDAPGVHIIKISANPDSQKTYNQHNVHYLIKPIHVNSITELIQSKSYSV